ncbi:unnamed protein product [Caenorhabditis bovis]|uniref:Nuclear receptor domain-containing protein n=1 Tax=Caenorhabditis bovis TaxID=2654633 RepID=A0A8S1F5E6_9PELO|nr:unnamed protein product [Caenorhabditis bovis]
MGTETTCKKPCSVCLKASHGCHFGAETCRACAAFFRRSVFLKIHYNYCRNAKNNCWLENGKWLCKKCRLRRCYNVGMQEKNVQYDRDLFSIRGKMAQRIPRTMEQFAGRPHILLLFDPKLASPNKTIIDLQPLIDKLHFILGKKNPTPRYLENKNLFERIVSSFNNLFFSENTFPKENRTIQIISRIGKQTMLKRMSTDLLKAAQCAMQTHMLDNVPLPIKMRIISNFWEVWDELNKLFLTLHIKGPEWLNGKIFLVNSIEAIDVQNTDFEVTWITKYPKDQIVSYYRYMRTDTFKKICELLKKINPSVEESIFIIFFVCLTLKGRNPCQEMSEYTESIIDTLTDCLHDYYSKTLKLNNYSHRLSQLLAIKKVIEFARKSPTANTSASSRVEHAPHFSGDVCSSSSNSSAGQKPTIVKQNMGEVQYDRDLLSTGGKLAQKIPRTMEQFAGRPHILLLFDPELASPNKTVIDVSPMLDRVYSILCTDVALPPNLLRMNLLQRIVHVFEQQSTSTYDNYQMISNMGKEQMLAYVERDIIGTALCAMGSHMLENIPIEIRMRMVGSFWKLWSNLGKLFLTINVRGDQVQNDKVFLLNGDEAVDLNNTDFDISWMTRYSKEHIDLYMRCIQGNAFERVFDILNKIKPSMEEAIFMSCMICLYDTGKCEGGEIQEIAESLIDSLTDCLHDYYSNTLKLANYSHRLSLLLQFKDVIIVSTMETTSTLSKCAICEKPSHGIHFSVESCRACSAFFRRSVYLRIEFKCKNNNNCKWEDGRWKCKKCRLKRCYEAGMQEKNIQYDRDKISRTENLGSSAIQKIPRTFEQCAGRPHILLLFDPELASPEKTYIDVSPLLNQARLILSQDSPLPSNFKHKNLLQRYVYVFEKLVTSIKKNQLKLISNMGKTEMISCVEHGLLEAAQCSMHSHMFDNVPINIRIIVLNSKQTVDWKNTDFDTSWLTNYSKEQMIMYYRTLQTDSFVKVFQHLKKIKPSVEEAIFITCIVCLSYKDIQYHRDLLKTTDKNFSSVISKKDLGVAKRNPRIRNPTYPRTMEQFAGRPHILLLFDPELASPNKTLIDVNPMLDKVYGILCKQLDNVGKTEMLGFLENGMIEAAQYVMDSHMLDQVPLNIKMKLVCNFWQLWAELGNTFLTLQVRGEKLLKDKIFLVNNNQAIDWYNTNYEISWVPNYSKEQMNWYYRCLQTDPIERSFNVISKMKPTIEEAIFIIGLVCLSYKGRNSSPELSEYAESIVDTLTDCLHDYYSNTLKLTNYSHRLSQLLTIKKIMDDHSSLRRQQFDLSNKFDVFSIQFSHPELFDLCF